MADDTVTLQLENCLRTMEDLFEAPKQPMPDVSLILSPGPTKYDTKLKKVQLGQDFENSRMQDYHRIFALGKAMGNYTYLNLNPKIFERIYVEANEKYHASKKTALNLDWQVAKQEYLTIIPLADSIVPVYAGLLYTDRKLGREKAERLGAEILAAASIGFIVETLDAILDDKIDLDRLQKQNVLDAIGWFETERNLLPQLARITTRREYAHMVKVNEVYSTLLKAV